MKSQLYDDFGKEKSIGKNSQLKRGKVWEIMIFSHNFRRHQSKKII